MHKKSLFLLLSAFSLFAFEASAQKDKRFGSSTEATSIVKFTPTKIFRGVVEFGYEHAIGDRSSLEISAGPTVSNVSPFGNGHGIFDFSHGLGNSTGSHLGMHVSVGYRFYPVEDKWVMNGFYVSPVISFTRFNYEFQDFYNGTGLPAQDGFRQETGFGFIFGTQNWLSKYFGLDMYLGAGLKSMSYESYFTNYDFNTNTPVWVKQSTDRASWFLTGGIKVGIGAESKK